MAEALPDAMNTYYRGERNKLFLIVAGSLLSVIAAIAFHNVGVPYLARAEFYTGAAEQLGHGFALGVGTLILPVALLALWRWRREAALAARTSAALETPEALHAVGSEARHIATVVVQSTRRQTASLVLGVAAVVTATVLGHPFVVGLAASVLLLVVSEQVLDHLTNLRASDYARFLGVKAAETLV